MKTVFKTAAQIIAEKQGRKAPDPAKVAERYAKRMADAREREANRPRKPALIVTRVNVITTPAAAQCGARKANASQVWDSATKSWIKR